MIRQLKDYVAVIGVTDTIQDNTAVYEAPVQARDAIEAASKVKLTRRQYVSEVRLAAMQSRVITQNLNAQPAIDASPGAAPLSLKELAAQADAGIEALDGVTEDESFPDEAFQHAAAGPLDQFGLDTFRSIQ